MKIKTQGVRGGNFTTSTKSYASIQTKEFEFIADDYIGHGDSFKQREETLINISQSDVPVYSGNTDRLIKSLIPQFILFMSRESYVIWQENNSAIEAISQIDGEGSGTIDFYLFEYNPTIEGSLGSLLNYASMYESSVFISPEDAVEFAKIGYQFNKL